MYDPDSKKELPFRVGVLVFIENSDRKFLLLKRKKSPNLGCWTPIGGKLEMAQGESPFSCAVREVQEEAGMTISAEGLHLFAMVSEKSYENKNHWLLFLFKCHKAIKKLPNPIPEGDFEFFSRDAIDDLILPPSDRKILWPIYDQYNQDFVVLQTDCHPEREMEFILEGSHSVLQSRFPYGTVQS